MRRVRKIPEKKGKGEEMSRCRACDAVLTESELLVDAVDHETGDTVPEDMCKICRDASYSSPLEGDDEDSVHIIPVPDPGYVDYD